MPPRPLSRWVVAPPPGPEAIALSGALGLSPLTAGILAARLGTTDPAAVRAFLRPSLGDLFPPRALPDMEKAAGRIARAIRDRERIVVHGDYDTDGVSATALLVRMLRLLGAEVASKLPHRFEDGYGIGAEFLREAIESRLPLLITVDCGTAEGEKISRLREAGTDVIVTDHHEPGAHALPPAFALVNPKRPDADGTGRDLTGSGLAFMLAWAVCEAVAGRPKVGDRLQEALLSVLPFAALGTIADVAPLTGPNRILVTYGLKGFARAQGGVAALLAAARVDPTKVTATQVAWALSPRLNAAGRLGDADLALSLLLEDDPGAGAATARELENRNEQRQKLGQELLEAARSDAAKVHNLDADGGLVLAGNGWHEGVIGIAAGRLADEFSRPVAVIALGADEGKGSARSVPGFNLFAALEALAPAHFLSFGGHEQAAGFRIRREAVEPFRRAFAALCRERLGSTRTEAVLTVDAEASLADLDEALARELTRLEPFGSGNPVPRFVARGVRVAGEPRPLGKSGRHFEFNASQNGSARRVVVFDQIDLMRRIDEGARDWDLVFTLSLNDFRGTAKAELMLKEMRERT